MSYIWTWGSRGCGAFALQDFGYAGSAIPKHNRAMLLGVRTTGRRIDGTWVLDATATGDMSGFMNWTPGTTGNPRTIGTWREMFLCVTIKPDEATGSIGGGSRDPFDPGELPDSSPSRGDQPHEPDTPPGQNAPVFGGPGSGDLYPQPPH